MAISEQVEQMEREELEDFTVSLYENLEERVESLEESKETAKAERDELQTKIQKDMPSNSTFRYTFAKMAEEISGMDVDDYSAEPHEHMSKFAVVRDNINGLTRSVEEHKGALDSIGHGKPEGKDDAWQRIVKAAENLEGNSGENTVNANGRYDVVLYWNNIQQATGYSERYCKKLISEFGDEESDHKKRGAKCKDYEPAAPQNNHTARRKRLFIDLSVWGDE